MARIKRMFEFEFRGEKITLPVNGSHTLADGDVLTVKKYNPKWGETLQMLWCNINGSRLWFDFEKGKRTANGIERNEFNIIEL